MEEKEQDEQNDHKENKIMFTPQGDKYAIVIGINYKDNESENDDLYGCINDVNNICDMLKTKCHFHEDQIMKLVGPAASKNNIMEAIDLLIHYSHTVPNSEFWFSYSGHGGGKFSFHEEDNQSEFICPYDYLTNGLIDDSWLKEHFVNELNSDSKCFVVMDCCNSGSNLNLPYKYSGEEGEEGKEKTDSSEIINPTMSNIIKISGSRDDQTSADYFDMDSRSYQGALTNNFLKNLSTDSIVDIFHRTRNTLSESKFTQRPELTYTNKNLIHYSLYSEK